MGFDGSIGSLATSNHCYHPRIDYLLERVSQGKARVWTGEVGELGRLGSTRLEDREVSGVSADFFFGSPWVTICYHTQLGT